MHYVADFGQTDHRWPESIKLESVLAKLGPTAAQTRTNSARCGGDRLSSGVTKIGPEPAELGLLLSDVARASEIVARIRSVNVWQSSADVGPDSANIGRLE